MQRIPQLCGPRRDGRYYVTDPVTRRPLYFGTDPEQAEAQYEAWRSLYLARRNRPATTITTLPTVASLCAAYLEHAEGYYRKRGRRTSEYLTIRDALGCLAGLGHLPAAQLTPSRLKDARELMVTSKGWSRKHINNQVARIRRMVRWAVEEELLPASVLQQLAAVAPLKRNRTAARENPPITAIAWKAVEATLPHLRPRHRAAVGLQWWTGLRCEEVVALRPCDLDRSRTPWVYVVAAEWNKTDHHERERRVPLGPQARALLEPLLAQARRPDSWLFPSIGRGGSAGYRGPLTVSGYRQAIARACVRARVPHWFPLQLRHAALTRIRARFGLEGAATIGGHAEVETTQVYAEVNWELAEQIAEEMG